MSSRSRRTTTDENSDPGTGLDHERNNMLVTSRPATIKLEQKPDVSPIVVREQSAKRKYPTYMERKRSSIFKHSGMKQGAILKFLIKNEQNQAEDENENQRVISPTALENDQLGPDIDFSPQQDTSIDKLGDSDSGIANNVDSSLRPANRLNVDCDSYDDDKELIRSDYEGLPQTPVGPSVAENRHFFNRKLFPEENTPEKSITSSPSTPPCKILKVYSLINATPTKRPHTPDTQPSSSALSKVRKMILTWKESDDPDLEKLIEKKNWKKALEKMTQGLNNGTTIIPKREYVCQLIRSTILCEGCRVAKEVQKNATEFLERLMQTYPAQYVPGKDQSTQYYKDILEKVFQNDDEAINGQGTFNFLKELLEQVKIDLRSKVETTSLRLLYLVTDLVCHQYEDYCGAPVKLRPSLLQHFIEQDGKLEYNTNCKYLTKELFESNTYEEFCLLIKWTNLIARRLGDFSHTQKAFKEMVSHFSELCLKRNDLGLRIFMNIECRNLSKKIFQKVIREKMDFKHAEQADGSNVTDDMCFQYLEKLANSMMIKPLVHIISQVRRQPCELIRTLTFERPYLECLKEEFGEKASTSRGINTKGETRLHGVCGPTDTHEADKEFEKRILSNPKDINAPDYSGNTPLHDCCRYDKGNILRTLYRLCVDEKLKASQIDFMPYNGCLETPFHLAATYCSEDALEVLKGFAQVYKVFDFAILTPNGEGKLPFEMARNGTIRTQLKPPDYDYDESRMLVQDGITLTPESVTSLKTSFELKAIIAWWNKCYNPSSDVTH